MASESSTSEKQHEDGSTSADSACLPKRRISKACESCRTRRIRCSGEPSCRNCLRDSLDCNYRQKARPSRKIKGVQGLASLPETSSAGQGPLAIGLRAVEQDLEALYAVKTGVSIDLSPPPLDTHPLLQLDTPLPPLPALSRDEGNALLQLFLDEVHVAFGYLSKDRLLQLNERYHSHRASLGDDQLALLFAVYALGSYRSITRAQGGMPPPFGAELSRPDIAFHRQSAEHAARVTSITSLHALVTLQFHSVTGNRGLIGRMVVLLQELGLHRKGTSAAYPPEAGAAGLLFYTVFIDTYCAGVIGEQPFLHSFDSDLIDAHVDSGLASREMAHLIVLQHAFLMDCHSGKKDVRSPQYVLEMEAKLLAFQREHGERVADNSMGAILPNTHYHWQRILVRAPVALDPLLGLSSFPVMIRSASQITQNFNTLFDIQRYFYPILLRLIGAGNILVQAAARAEMPQREAEDLLSVVLQFLKDLAPRSSTATTGHSNLCALATAFDLNIASLSSPGWNGDLVSQNPIVGALPSADLGDAFSFPTSSLAPFPENQFWMFEELWGPTQLGESPF